MNIYLPGILVGYFIIGLVTLLFVRRHPNHFGASAELLELAFLCIWDPLGILLGLFIWALWPLILILGLFTPAITLHATMRSALEKVTEIGATGECVTDLAPSGKVMVNGAIRDATSLNKYLNKGSPVKVVAKRGFNLIVEPT